MTEQVPLEVANSGASSIAVHFEPWGDYLEHVPEKGSTQTRRAIEARWRVSSRSRTGRFGHPYVVGLHGFASSTKRQETNCTAGRVRSRLRRGRRLTRALRRTASEL